MVDMLMHLAGAVPLAAQGNRVFPPLDTSTFVPQLVWLALTFGTLYLLLSKLALPRLGDIIEQRRRRIRSDLAEAERLKSETDAALKAYEQSLADARGRAQGIAKETRDRLAAEVEQERNRVDQQIAQKLTDTERQIAATKARALASVNDIAADTAGAIVGRLLGEDVGAAEIKSAVAGVTRG
jgi:F-type H+-transporting ATPase subunit b